MATSGIIHRRCFSVWISITHIDCDCTDQIDVQRDQPISQRPA